MKKQIIVLVALITLLFTGCGSETKPIDAGQIQPTDISEYEEKSNSLFNTPSLSFDYRNKTVYSELTGLKLQIPETWSLKKETLRHLVITSPSDDEILSDCTFHLLFCLNTNISSPNPSEYDEVFDAEATCLTYTFEGTEYCEDVYNSPTRKFVDERVTNNPKELSCSIYSDIDMTTGQGKLLEANLVSIRYNFLAGNIPVTLRTVVKAEDEEIACDLLAMLTSSFEMYESPAPSLMEAELSGVKLQLPAAYKKSHINGKTIYSASEYEDSPYSGMAVTVTEMNLGNFDGYEFSKGPLKSIGSYFIPQGKYTCMYSVIGATDSILLGDLPAEFAVCNLTYHQKEDSAGTFLGTSGDAVIFLYLLKDENGDKVISFFFKPFQAKEAVYIDQLIREAMVQ